MSSPFSHQKSQSSPLWFTVPAVAMLLAGFGLMLYVALGPRLSSTQGALIPAGFATAGLGGALLTRSQISVFSLVVYALIGLIFAIRDLGTLHPITWLFVALIPYSVVLMRRAEP